MRSTESSGSKSSDAKMTSYRHDALPRGHRPIDSRSTSSESNKPDSRKRPRSTSADHSSGYPSSHNHNHPEPVKNGHSKRRRLSSEKSVHDKLTRSDKGHKAQQRASPASQRPSRDHSQRPQRERHRKAAKRRRRRDDENIVHVGEVVDQRFEVTKVLGEGSFGQVLECRDRHTRQSVAVKALKPLDNYKHVAQHEIDVLKTLADAESRGSASACIRALNFFEWHRIFFIVFPKLGASVYQFLEQNDFQPYTPHQSASICRQMCQAVRFMQRMRLTHTDLKPENVLFVNDAYDEVPTGNGKRTYHVLRDTTIRVIDFGSATYDHEHHSRTIQTRHYRAPEVVLELGWSTSADLWSVGCILFELVTGKCLFMTHDNLEHLAMMERLLGSLPRSMVKATRRQGFFYKGRLDWNPDSSDGKYVRRNLRSLGDYWFRYDNRLLRLALDLVRELLRYRPSDRVSASQALRHPFLNLANTLES